MSFPSDQKRIRKSDATQTASSRQQLEQAVLDPGATVWIPESATIDMTGSSGNPIAPNVTIASNRGIDGGQGGMIKTDGFDHGLFVASSQHCRLTGLRLKGPRTDYFDIPATNYGPWSAVGFKLRGTSATVDHCEVFGWTFAGLLLGSKDTPTSGWIHHNFMHHNQMNHLGYPIELYNGVHLIEWNSFDYNRHSIAGFGYWTNGYEARYNFVGPNAIRHAFDMHYLGENLDGLSSKKRMRAGKYVNVHHNIFTLTDFPAFSIQGYPKQYARFVNNWCADSDRVAFALDNVLEMRNNKYGKKAVKKGQQWLRQKSQSVSTDNSSNTTPVGGIK